jgi:hypothetical protein
LNTAFHSNPKTRCCNVNQSLQDPHLKSQALVRSALAEDTCTGEIALHYKVKSNPSGCYIPAYDFYALGQLLAFILARGNEALHQKVVCMAAAAYHAGNQPDHYHGVRALLGSHPSATKGLLDVLVALLGPMESRPCSYRALQQLLLRARMECRCEPDAKQNWSSISSLLSSGCFCHYDDEVLIGQVEEGEDETDCMEAAAAAGLGGGAAAGATCPVAAAAVRDLQQQVQRLQQRKPLATLRQRVKKTVWCGFKKILRKCTVMLLPCVRGDATRFSDDESGEQQQQQAAASSQQPQHLQQLGMQDAAASGQVAENATAGPAAAGSKQLQYPVDSRGDAAGVQPPSAAGKPEAVAAAAATAGAAAAAGSSGKRKTKDSTGLKKPTAAGVAAAAAGGGSGGKIKERTGSTKQITADASGGTSALFAAELAVTSKLRSKEGEAPAASAHAAAAAVSGKASSKERPTSKKQTAAAPAAAPAAAAAAAGANKAPMQERSGAKKPATAAAAAAAAAGTDRHTSCSTSSAGSRIDDKSTKRSAARTSSGHAKSFKRTKSSKQSSKVQLAAVSQRDSKAFITADLQQLAGDLGLVSLTADAKPKRAASKQLEQDKSRKQKQSSSSSSKHADSGAPKRSVPQQQKQPSSSIKRADNGARKRVAPQHSTPPLQPQQQSGISSSSGSSSRPDASASLRVDAPLSLFELMVLLPGQQVDEVMEVQEMLGWLLFSDDH